MNWRLKAIIQNLIDQLPYALSHSTYYRIQRYFGGLKNINPIRHLEKSIGIVRSINKHDYDIRDKTFLEIGTGRTITVPIGLWLCGASEIISVDLHNYLKEELVFESLKYIRTQKDEVQNLFGDLGKSELFRDRLSQLLSIDMSLNELLVELNIKCFAPADAASLPLMDNSIDYHYSTNVFEHISTNLIGSILSEANRVLSKDGLFIHRIDLSDHFSHIDDSITTINFLQYSDKRWSKFAGNKFMYHNRLRIYDFLDLFNKEGANLLTEEKVIDDNALKLLKTGFPLDERFSGKPYEELAVSFLGIVGSFTKH